MGLSPCTAWVGPKYIGEVISPFRTVPRQEMTAPFLFFQSLPPKKANYVKKRPIELGVILVTPIEFQNRNTESLAHDKKQQMHFGMQALFGM